MSASYERGCGVRYLLAPMRLVYGVYHLARVLIRSAFYTRPTCPRCAGSGLVGVNFEFDDCPRCRGWGYL